MNKQIENEQHTNCGVGNDDHNERVWGKAIDIGLKAAIPDFHTFKIWCKCFWTAQFELFDNVGNFFESLKQKTN